MNIFIAPKGSSNQGLMALMLAAISMLILAAAPAYAHWPNTNATKFVQMPHLTTNGMDIFFGNYPTILADDFVCTNTGPITDIHLWISSVQNVPTTQGQFELSIWSDVPADPAAGLPSHPGVRLWSEVFVPGDYQVVAPWATGLQEEFWNLDPPLFMGPDTNLFQCNFYPKQPYSQTGLPTAPKIYWLGVSMQNDSPPQGWKTSPDHLAPDDAVLGHYPSGGGSAVTDWKELFDPRHPTVSLNFSFALTTTNPPTSACHESTVKFVQPPNLDQGFDVWDSGPWVLADDFICTNTGPITDIHVWGSWLNDLRDTNTTFWLALYEDVPAGPASPSHPTTNLVWQQWFGPGQYDQTFWAPGIEQFMDPGPPAIMGPETNVYYYCFYPTNPPVQIGTPNQPKIYWLALYAQPSQGTANLFGWKTTRLRQFDISVHASWPGGPPTGGWIPTISPNNQPLDLAFKITTDTNQPPPCCPETNGVKFLQPPNVINGHDVLASRDMTLADDFLCIDTGPISDIHIWGSWLRDTVGPNATFTLGIWSDIPAVTNATGRYRSSPGEVLWSQTFGPGEYAQCFYTNVTETFYDPSVPAILGGDSNIYYYCFFPTNRFVQQGTSAKPTNYWLSVNVQPPAGAQPLFGWHTSATSYNDDAVWFKGPVLPFVPAPAAWNEMFDLQGRSLNLAFKITTATNGCPPMAVTCPAAKTVECATFWTFDSPTVVDPCCGTNYTITVINTSTSGVCPQTITRTWAIADCLGLAANCSQTVTVVDTTPPVITCGTNKTVECGSNWSFDPPSAIDRCCGTNVVITMLSTVTNGSCPLTISRTWAATDCCTNQASCTQTVTVVDTTPPVITCGTNKTVECGSNWDFDAPSAFDLCCGTNVIVRILATTTNGVCPQTITRIWEAVDCCTNRATCAQTVTVVDTTPPVLTCASNKTVQCGSSWSFDPPTAFDACCGTDVTIRILNTTTNGKDCSIVIQRTWEATDCCTNRATCAQTVTVVDTTPPVLTCATNKTVQCGAAWSFDPPSAIDACCGTNVTITVVNNSTSGVCPQLIKRTWQATDCCTNSAFCTQTVTVVDTIPPTITCPSNIVIVTCNTNEIVTWSVSASDSCSPVSVVSAPPSGSSFALGTTNTVHVTATDACSNSTSCSFTVAIVRPPLGTLTITRATSTITITWTGGVLQQANSLLGPWSDVPSATSPYSFVIPSTSPFTRFYRLRCSL